MRNEVQEYQKWPFSLPRTHKYNVLWFRGGALLTITGSTFTPSFLGGVVVGFYIVLRPILTR